MLILIRAEVDKKHECPVMFGRFDRGDFASGGGKKIFFLYSSLLFSPPPPKKKIG